MPVVDLLLTDSLWIQLQDLAAQARYVRAERALNAIATLSLQKVHVRGDDPMSRSTSSKTILRLERFLSTRGIEARFSKSGYIQNHNF